MVPFDRALVALHSNFLSTEILPLLFSMNATFSLPHLDYPQNVPIKTWEYVDRLLATKSEGVGLIDCLISFQDFQHM